MHLRASFLNNNLKLIQTKLQLHNLLVISYNYGIIPSINSNEEFHRNEMHNRPMRSLVTMVVARTESVNGNCTDRGVCGFLRPVVGLVRVKGFLDHTG